MSSESFEKSDRRELTLPLLPLRDMVVFPKMVSSLFIGRDRSVAALQAVMRKEKTERRVLLLTQRDEYVDEPDRDALYKVGVVATILQVFQTSNGILKVMVEGNHRATVRDIADTNGYMTADVSLLEEEGAPTSDEGKLSAVTRNLLSKFQNYIGMINRDSAGEIIATVSGLDNDPGRLTDMVATHVNMKISQRQELLETLPVIERVEKLLVCMNMDVWLIKLDQRLHKQVKKQMEKSQQEYYLNEKLKAIQKKLGEIDENSTGDVERIEKSLRAKGMPEKALNKGLSELKKLKMMAPLSAEASVLRGYLDCLLALPWNKRSRLSLDIAKARRVLDEDHYGLEKVKERVLEHLAVQKRVKRIRGPILCLVGPPGVGKTSLGESIAKATNRKFVRLSLGGVRDEAEIRGHRRTYIGSMPGRIVQKMGDAGTLNPLFLLDEIDKVGTDYRGDPAAALLEVLDPEQNQNFSDHYLEVGYDLSEVMFVCTANSLSIPPPLLDRMEVIHLPGYTENEKLTIAQRYLLPKQMKNSGLAAEELHFDKSALMDIIRHYTRESGVRGLEKEIAKIARKVVLEHAEAGGGGASKRTSRKSARGKPTAARIRPNRLEHYCGVRRYDYGSGEAANEIGRVYGLAWTNSGGDLLTIEATVVPGKARQILTGSLGDVMKESIQAAISVVRARAKAFGVPADFLEKRDVHIHVPEGATPKDGPSAGVCMCVALLSTLTGIPVRADVGMTGEITLGGKVLPVGGLKEKLLAAQRAGLRLVMIPAKNERDLKEIDAEIKKGLDIKTVSGIDEVLELSLEHMPKIAKSRSKSGASKGAKAGTLHTPQRPRMPRVSRSGDGMRPVREGGEGAAERYS